ncbi:pentapeptide repeat-containing protein [Micromonospora chersina]|uniref:pentapeptide repeat-containing protein n=1 Tax=Micromonospora chersina TaxID=47854 RepID=UPI0033E72F49
MASKRRLAARATRFAYWQFHKLRRRFRHEVPGWLWRLVVGLLVTLIAVGVSLVIWRGPFWFDRELIEGVKDPEKKVQAVASARATLLQIALAFGGLATIIFTARTYLLTKSGQVADRYTKAATQLVSKSPAERIGAIYALARLMKDSPRDHRAVVDLLAGFVRQSRPYDEDVDYDSELEFNEGFEGRLEWVGEPLPIDVQTALTALAKRPKRYESPWIVLKNTDLAGASFIDAWVNGLHFQRSNLQGADFVRAKAVNGVAFAECDLRAANLSGASLPVSHLSDADFRGALIRRVDLRGAFLSRSDFRGAVLRGSNLHQAILVGADLRGVDLSEVKGLTVSQIASAVTDQQTLLPEYLMDTTAPAPRSAPPPASAVGHDASSATPSSDA